MNDAGPTTRDEALSRIESALGDRLAGVHQPTAKRIYLELDAQFILEAASVLSDLQARLQTASAIDAPKEIEILYHWALDSIGLVITVRTRVDRDSPEIASITQKCPAAEWIEREMWELMGISFRGHPNMQHLLLQEDWPANKYPLRRDYRKE